MTGRIAHEVYDGVRCAFRDQPTDPAKHLWRTLVRVVAVDVDNGTATVEIPGWHSDKPVEIRLDGVPGNVRDRFAPDFRCHARVNIGAETAGELTFADWEEQ